MSELPADDTELVEYEPELFVGDGELWVRDRDAFCDAFGIAALFTYDGCPQAVIPGKGVISLHKLLSESTKDAAKVRAIMP